MDDQRVKAIRAAWAQNRDHFGRFGDTFTAFLPVPETSILDDSPPTLPEVVTFRLERGLVLNRDPSVRFDQIVCDSVIVEKLFHEPRADG